MIPNTSAFLAAFGLFVAVRLVAKLIGLDAILDGVASDLRGVVA